MKKYFIWVAAGLLANLNVSAQNLDWVTNIDGANTNSSYDIVTDASGNVYITGQFSGTTDFNPSAADVYNLTSVGFFDAFVAKYDATGDFIWAKQVGGAIEEGAISRGIDLDAAGNVYFFGDFKGTADFDPNAGVANLTALNNNMFVCKLTNDGDYVWAKVFEGVNASFSLDIKVDSDGSVYTTGQFQGITDFDPGVAVYNLSAINGDAFLSKLDNNGNFVWAHKFTSTGSDSGNGLYIDDADDIYFTGSFKNTIDFDLGAGEVNLTSNGETDVFVCKLDSDAGYIWATSFGGISDDFGNAITVDGSDNIYVTGNFDGTVDFDPSAAIENATSVGWYDVYVSKFDASGDYQWAKQFGGSTFDFGMSIGTDAAGNVYVGGIYQMTVDFDGGAGTENHTSAGLRDMFIEKLDEDGNFINVKVFGGTTDDNLQTILVDADNNVYATGSFNGTVDFDPNAGTSNLISTGQQDGFILKLTQSTASLNDQNGMFSTIYPNPATTQITIQTNENVESVLIYNLKGELVQTTTQKNISIENLTAGLYLMTIKTSTGISQVKFVKE
jgi:uncharacterized protein (DUF2249 family)